MPENQSLADQVIAGRHVDTDRRFGSVALSSRRIQSLQECDSIVGYAIANRSKVFHVSSSDSENVARRCQSRIEGDSIGKKDKDKEYEPVPRGRRNRTHGSNVQSFHFSAEWR